MDNFIILPLIVIILSLSHLLLRKIFFGNEKAEREYGAVKADLIGKPLLFLMMIIIYSLFIEENMIEWFFIAVVITIMGFQTFIDWKYLKGSKQYILSLAVGILGVGLVGVFM
ncbi:DUF4181 domain-containing protein [Cytobacillus gottheilii]|uniref:DUF4181 domain-containing protein n=1 Tax=Cytobacillus gottheilii TaxID=859144 RepID=A0ABX8FB95_9BACI|nr:DUF4181 domain-containing protein [Cytobacillus gottheilii]QVY61459.1 DUF4181 domain-containing protein [Cytobacillus gottheilii]